MTDAVLVPVTLAHMAGLLHGVLHPLGCGVKAVIQDKWDAEDALDAIETEAVTMLFGPPIFSIGVAAAPGFSSERVRSIRLISSGSTPISEAYVDRTRTTYDCIVKRSYGSSEAPLIFNTFPGDPPERGWSTDGRPAPGVEVQIRDVDTSEVLSSGATGEIWVRGPELCDGYLDSEDTTSTFIGGWMRTHDLASIDPQGYLRITGRISSFIIRGGMNISATELQSALTRHPLIQQAVVLGVPDEVYGERVVAFVTASEVVDRDMCAQWFAEIGLAKYKIPDRVVTLAELPLLPTFQKPDIAKLRSMI